MLFHTAATNFPTVSEGTVATSNKALLKDTGPECVCMKAAEQGRSGRRFGSAKYDLKELTPTGCCTIVETQRVERLPSVGNGLTSHLTHSQRALCGDTPLTDELDSPQHGFKEARVQSKR